jgi:transcriptional regulator with XRE-family HTH domain
MTGEEFRQTLERLNLNQAAFADYTKTSRRAVSNWTRRGPPHSIVLLLQWMQKTYIPSVPAGQKLGPSDVRAALEPAIGHVIGRAYNTGYAPDQITKAVKSIADEYQDLTEQARGLVNFHDNYASSLSPFLVRARGRPKGS